MPSWQEPQNKGQPRKRNRLQSSKKASRDRKAAAEKLAVSQRWQWEPGSPGQRDCAVSSGTGGLLRGRTLPPSSNASWFSISLTKFREHWTSPWPGKKLRNSWQRVSSSAQVLRRESELSTYTGTSWALNGKWLRPHSASETKGLDSSWTWAPMQNASPKQKCCFSRDQSFFSKQEESCWPSRTKDLSLQT